MIPTAHPLAHNLQAQKCERRSKKLRTRNTQMEKVTGCPRISICPNYLYWGSYLRSDDDAGGPIKPGDKEIFSIVEYRNQFIDLLRVAVGPVRLRQHIVNHVQPAALQQAQGFFEMSVFAWPGIGEDQVESETFGSFQPPGAVRMKKTGSRIIAKKLFCDVEDGFVHFDGNQARAFVHPVEQPRRCYARARAQFKEITGRLRRRKRAEQTARERVGSHREVQARGLRHNLRQSRREFDIFSVVHSDSEFRV